MTRMLLIAIAALVCVAPPSHACTTFCFVGDHVIFGKNYDWNVDTGLVIVNKRGVVKQAMVEQDPISWTSRFGSVTFNQYGREFPSGGMNEGGLVIELMWLDDTEYPGPDSRGELPTLQWIQYQLDNVSTVAEVVASDKTVRVSGRSAKIHFLLADAGGNVTAIEYLEGRMVVHRGDDMPYPALTNDTYRKSARWMRDRGAAPRGSSLDRFARAGRAAQAGPAAGVDPVAAAFDVLADVAQGEFTQWSIVYHVPLRRVYFRTRRYPDVRWIDMAGLDFACQTPVRLLDMNTGDSGDVTARLRDYEFSVHRAQVGQAFSETEFLRGVPGEELDRLARFGEAMRCTP
jgi:choloylglycine hydrolase